MSMVHLCQMLGSCAEVVIRCDTLHSLTSDVAAIARVEEGYDDVRIGLAWSFELGEILYGLSQ